MNQIKVLIIDDSSLVRQTLISILSSFVDIVIVGAANDPYMAVEIIKKVVPDVIILDIEMPKMDGITFLQKLMSQHPIPVIICSSIAEEGSETALKALEYGAVDIIVKPKIGVKGFLEESKIRFYEAIKAAYATDVKKFLQRVNKADLYVPKHHHLATVNTTDKVIAIGASTGGTEAIRVILENLPIDIPGIVIVQHMPEGFTKAFAKRLDSLCKITVKEAEDGESVLKGKALIAPGNKHLILKRSGAKYYIEVKDGPFVNRHRPSVDVLFRSVAQNAGKNAIGVLLTGMGDDGAKGLLEIKEAGGFTIAESEETCVVFGMPAEAIKKNAAIKILPLYKISFALIEYLSIN
jgi:two-component system chemotaxis response regulator CheB